MMQRLSKLDGDQVAFKDALEKLVLKVSPLAKVQKLDNEKHFNTELHAEGSK